MNNEIKFNCSILKFNMFINLKTDLLLEKD